MRSIAISDRGVVAAPHSLAVETGRSILEEGGNALEAMVAMAATIAVTYPHMSGLGGDGFWMIREPSGKVGFIDAAGPAGSGATIASYNNAGHDTVPPRGPLGACTVAGVVSGWSMALEASHEARGRLPLDVLLSDAVRYARDGYAVSDGQGANVPKLRDDLFAAPGFADNFLTEGKLPAGGDLLKQPALASTFEQLSYASLDDFYRGDLGREIGAELARIGSPVSREDLERYEARIRTPLSLSLKLGQVWNSPPPTQGLASLLILGIAERLDLGRPESADFVHGLVEATKRAFLIRDLVVTDPRHLDHEPASFLDPARLEREAQTISRGRAMKWPAPPLGDGDTVWLGCIDRDGRAVSYIQSLYWEWGSGCVLPTTGVLWQNRGAGFSLDPDARNPLEPGRFPFHTLSPAIARMKDGRVMVYGTQGGDGQPQTQGAVFVRHAGFDIPLEEAIELPRWRLGRGWGAIETSLKLEPRFDSQLIEELERRGHEIEMLSKPYTTETGTAGIIVLHPSGRIEGVHDPRGDGGALGL